MKHILVAVSVLLFAACQTTGGRGTQPAATDDVLRLVTKSSEVLVIYIGANDCPPCLAYRNLNHPDWLQSKEYPHVQFHALEFPQFGRTDEDRYWPKDLRWVRDTLNIRAGAPRWVVAIDGRIVANDRGRSGWLVRTYPLIQRLVAKKLTG